MIGWPIVNIHIDRYKTKRQKNELQNSSPNINGIFQLKKNEKGAASSTHGSKEGNTKFGPNMGNMITCTRYANIFVYIISWEAKSLFTKYYQRKKYEFVGGGVGACSINGYGTNHRQFGWNIGSLITWTVRYTLSCTIDQNLRNVTDFNNRKGQLLKTLRSKFLQWHWCVTLVLLLVFFFFSKTVTTEWCI